MSKSFGNSLDIADDLSLLEQKIRTMMTDPARERRKDPGDPGKCPVWDLHKFFNPDRPQMDEIASGCRSAGIGCIDCKKILMEHVTRHLTPIQERRKYFERRGDELRDILSDGARRARETAERTMSEVYGALSMPKD
jgi:tryptophanyl-tRNA synthetase